MDCCELSSSYYGIAHNNRFLLYNCILGPIIQLTYSLFILSFWGLVSAIVFSLPLVVLRINPRVLFWLCNHSLPTSKPHPQPHPTTVYTAY